MSTEPNPKFTFSHFNPRREQRGVEAAEFYVEYWDGDTDRLWMSAKDIKANLAEFGECAQLRQGLAMYKSK